MDSIAAYRNNSITTQSRGHLIVLLYDGAIKFLNQSVEAIEADQHDEKWRLIKKALDIIDELDSVLDMQAGGEVAMNLHSLYDFMRRHLYQANMKSDPRRVRDVVGLLEELNESWRAISS